MLCASSYIIVSVHTHDNFHNRIQNIFNIGLIISGWQEASLALSSLLEKAPLLSLNPLQMDNWCRNTRDTGSFLHAYKIFRFKFTDFVFDVCPCELTQLCWFATINKLIDFVLLLWCAKSVPVYSAEISESCEYLIQASSASVLALSSLVAKCLLATNPCAH